MIDVNFRSITAVKNISRKEQKCIKEASRIYTERNKMSKKARKEKSLLVAINDYRKAQFELVALRNEMFPVGTRVRCNITGMEGIVTNGSLYADQVYVENCFHMGFLNMEVIK